MKTTEDLIREAIEIEREKVRELTREYLRLDAVEKQRRELRIIEDKDTP